MTAQTITAICAVVVAGASLFVSIWTSTATRRRHRLSVRPHLRLDYIPSLDQTAKVTLVNNGLGTAIIGAVTVCVDGVQLGGILAEELVQALVGIGWLGGLSAYLPNPDDALSAGEQAALLSFPVIDSEERKALRTYLSRVTFSIAYQSMYGDKFLLARNALGLQEWGRIVVGRERR